MKREIVLSLSGGRVLTGSGLRPVAGNLGFGEGARVFVLDNAVLGQQRTQGRKKQFETVTTVPPVSPLGYKFADAAALKMYYVNSALEVQRTEDIAPVSGAILLAHTYNESAEYLIWFAGSRCIIQKNGAAFADFESVFPWEPEEIDAYVDGSGDLVWVAAAGWADGDCIIARYKNGTLQQSVDAGTIAAELLASVKSAAAAAMSGAVGSVSASPVLTSSTLVSETIFRHWVAQKAYAINDFVCDESTSWLPYKCIFDGESGATPPAWPTTLGGQVWDGAVKWELVYVNHVNNVTIETTITEPAHYFANEGTSQGGYIAHLGFMLWDLAAVATMQGGAYSARHGTIVNQTVREYDGGAVVSSNDFQSGGGWHIGWIYKRYGAKIGAINTDCLSGWAETTASTPAPIGPLLRVEISSTEVDGVQQDTVAVYNDTYSLSVSASLPGGSLSAERLESTLTVGDFALKQIADLDGPDWSDYKRWDEVAALTTESELLIGRAWSEKVGLIYGWPTSEKTNVITGSGVSVNDLPAIVTKRFTGVAI